MMKTVASALAFLSMMGDVEGQGSAPAFPAVQPPAIVEPPSTPSLPVPTSVIPIIPPPSGPGAAAPLEVICGDPCINTANCPSSCAQTMMTVTNPSNSFVMECQASGACAQSQYTFSYTGGMTTFLESIKSGAPYALYGSTFTIDNTARGTNLVVRTIECGHGLCAGATFRFLNADYGDIKCDEYAGCGAGCMVEMPPDMPVPCDQVSTT